MTNLAEHVLELAEKATPEPWEMQQPHESGSYYIVGANLGGLIGAAHPWPTEIDEQEFGRVKANAAFIAFTREAAPALARENIALREVLTIARERLAEHNIIDDGDCRECLGCRLGGERKIFTHKVDCVFTIIDAVLSDDGTTTKEG